MDYLLYISIPVVLALLTGAWASVMAYAIGGTTNFKRGYDLGHVHASQQILSVLETTPTDTPESAEFLDNLRSAIRNNSATADLTKTMALWER